MRSACVDVLSIITFIMYFVCMIYFGCIWRSNCLYAYMQSKACETSISIFTTNWFRGTLPPLCVGSPGRASFCLYLCLRAGLYVCASWCVCLWGTQLTSNCI